MGSLNYKGTASGIFVIMVVMLFHGKYQIFPLDKKDN